MKKILFIAPHRANRAPSQRFRFEQYLDFLEKQGFQCEFSYLVSSADDKYFYSKGKLLIKIILLIKYFFIRLWDVIRASNFDIVYIQREAYFFGPAFFEYLISKTKVKLIFDFDDSIWVRNVSEANKDFNWLKKYSKTAKIISYADLVFAGNNYLAEYASKYNKNVRIVPTTIDTQEYKKITSSQNIEKICIGWSGSITTIQHFEFATAFLTRIKEKYNNKVSFKVIGDGSYINENLNIKGLPWIKADELKEMSSFDIGIMPLPDDEWAKGKCGLKGLQYMALEVPTVMSPVGVNTEIIEDGVNGFLASTDDEWVEKISLLIESEELRRKVGANGRKTVIEKYSFEAHKNNYLKYFSELIGR